MNKMCNYNNKKLTFKNILNVDDDLKQEVRNWRNQDFVRNNMYNKHEITIREHNEFLESLKVNDKKSFFICFLKDRPIGIVSYSTYDKYIEFAYYLVEEKDLNKGYGAVLEYKFLNYFFTALKTNMVVCEVLMKNKKTISLHNKFGFTKDKVYLDLEKTNEEICRLKITIEQWRNSEKKLKKIINRIINIDTIGKIN